MFWIQLISFSICLVAAIVALFVGTEILRSRRELRDFTPIEFDLKEPAAPHILREDAVMRRRQRENAEMRPLNEIVEDERSKAYADLVEKTYKIG